MVAQNHYPPDGKIREAVGLFNNPKEMQETIDELEISGFPRYEISVLENNESETNLPNGEYSSMEALEDNPDTLRRINITREDIGFVQGVILAAGIFFGVVFAISVAAVFALSSPLAVIVGGLVGLLCGAYIAKLFNDNYNKQIKKQVKKGGMLLWVNTPNREKEAKACSILSKHHAQDVHVHEVSA